MVEIDTIALYGPGNLKPDDLVAGFVARENTLNYFLAELRHQIEPKASARHHLIIGQRGMGKTTLLHRIAIAIGAEPALAACFVPLTFREEQYNVINLHVFWRNCIEALLDWLEQYNRSDAASKLEAELRTLENAYEQNRRQEADGNSAGRVFRAACQRLQLRPVLLLDNLDLILDALKKHDWGLREALQENNGPLLLAAAAVYPQGLSDKKAAFFDFFRITTLQRLEAAEVRTCLQRLANQRGESGKRVSQLVRHSPGRIAALTEMTGGNPRTLAILYLLLENQPEGDAFADLEKLLDRMTPLYKARTEEAPPQARAVLDAVALAWDPITANAVSRESGLEVTVVNAQLSRLEKDGFVEKVPIKGSGRHGYQMIERFFNIWYLMRHGSRRIKLRVRWLTEFLRGFYSLGERETLARDFLRSGKHRADVMLALAETLDDPVQRKALNHAAGRDLLQQSDIREHISRLVDLRDIDPEQADMLELERQVLTMKRDWPKGLTAQQCWDLLGGSLLMSSAEKRCVIESLVDMDNAKLTELASTLRKETSELCETLNITGDQLVAYHSSVRNGCIRHPYDLQGASAAALHENSSDIAAIGCLLALKLNSDLDEVRQTHARFSHQSGALWARVVADPLFEQPETAERAFTRGKLLHHKYGEIKNAELAYRKAIELDPANPKQWNNLGNLLQDHLESYEEAELAYRKAIALDSEFVGAWGNLGDLLQDHLKRYEEAEVVYRRTIALGLNDTQLWNNFGVLLQYYLGRYSEAEQAYLHALELRADNYLSYLHMHLAILYWLCLERPETAQHHAALAKTDLDECGKKLLEVVRLLAEDTPKSAWSALDSALIGGGMEAWDSSYKACLNSILRHIHTHHYAAKFRAWMEAADYPARYAPLYWAFLALLEGEDVLNNVNPEVRNTAKRIYQGLVVGQQPESLPRKRQPRRRRKGSAD